VEDAVDLDDRVGADGNRRWRTHRLPGAQVEARLMERALDPISLEPSVGERRPLMGARVGQGEHLSALRAEDGDRLGPSDHPHLARSERGARSDPE
jgi:hypothetical protein